MCEFYRICSISLFPCVQDVFSYPLSCCNYAVYIHVPVGKASFTEEQLADNFQTLIDAIVKAKPAAAKGQYFRNVTITSTMGPGVKIDTTKFA